jgi:hypothetical protein
MDNSKIVNKNQSADELVGKGWLYHTKAEDEDAEGSFRAVEALYGLALVLKSQGRRKEAVQTFEQLINLLDMEVLSDKVRSRMLRRLAKAHVNEIETGDWNLEAEIWQKKN